MKKKAFIVFSVLLITNCLFASKIHKAFDALNIYDYFKAKKLFYASLKKEPVLASYGLSLIYFRQDNPFHNFDSSYRYIEKAFYNYHPDKDFKKLAKYGLSDSSLFAFKQKVHRAAYDYYLSNPEGSMLTTLEKFIEKEPNSIYINNAFYKRDSLAFQMARYMQNSEEMEKYIKNYPESNLLNSAYKDLDMFRFDEFSRAGFTVKIEKFIDSFPHSRYQEQAKDLLFEIALQKKSPFLLHKYIKLFPANSHIEQAWKTLYSVDVTKYSATALNNFLTKYPDFPYRKTIEQEMALANVKLITITLNGKVGAIDTTGEIIIDPFFDGLEEFSDGLALAQVGEKFGYINKLGETVVPFSLEDGEPFKDGRTVVKKDKRAYVIDRSGNRISEFYDQISDYNEGLAVVKQDGLYGAIDRNGKVEIPLEFARLGDFSEGISYAQKNDKSGYVDKNGDPVIQFMFEWAESFKNSLARVKYYGKYGLINKKGEFVLPAIYDRIDEHSKSIYVVYKNGFYGFTDSTGCLLSEVKYPNVSNEPTEMLTDGIWMRTISEDDQNLMDRNGKAIADAEEFEEMYLPHDDLIRVSYNEKYGFINEKKKTIIKPVYDDAEDFEDGVAIVRKRDKCSIINTTGQALFTIKCAGLEKVSETYFSYSGDSGMKIICNSAGQEFFSTYKDFEIIMDRFVIIDGENNSAVFDLQRKKYIFGSDAIQ